MSQALDTSIWELRENWRTHFFLGQTHASTLDLRAGGADFGNGLRKRERQRETHESGTRACVAAHANSSGRNGE